MRKVLMETLDVVGAVVMIESGSKTRAGEPMRRCSVQRASWEWATLGVMGTVEV
eukprot:CAMPEP_0173411552 /NCGR_PEP_ID=MMETSP1356-20130122/77288_1 /TAXON_ID=77927 ORGANISM="Hemiselmis virescens, Strain PCC157" /NCGR_SAMPLE_ID=MMETSP1356 /ASSEMBLY_ACC=CAM_ASM_000847 /LENGTH=53 /DNA_ID=CAMNT_0014373333 /DNA_START=326 /DNA_END=487 /DNA_ORIENTATION=+